MSNSKKIDLSGFYHQDLIDLATKAAGDSKEWRKLLDKAEAAGDISGAKAVGDVGLNIWHSLFDRLASLCPVAVTFDAPITSHLLADAQDVAETTFQEWNTAENALSEGGTQAEIDAALELKHVYCEARSVVEALIDFRRMVGVISAGIKSAQKEAERLARNTWCMADKGAKAKKARDAIQKLCKRDLEKYGFAVDLKTVQATLIPVKVEAPETDAQKAAKAIASAFKVSPSGAIDALLKLEPTTLATIKNAILRAEKAAQKVTAQEDLEHKEGAHEKLTGQVDGMPTDLVTVANSGESVDLAAQHLADLEAQGMTPEQESDLAAAASRGRRVSGL
jgi:hypothetical protein